MTIRVNYLRILYLKTSYIIEVDSVFYARTVHVFVDLRNYWFLWFLYLAIFDVVMTLN